MALTILSIVMVATMGCNKTDDPNNGGGGGNGGNTYNGHAYVDLGLPSGTLWATCNVGADAPEDYGDYFAWGETLPNGVYDCNTYQYFNLNDWPFEITKYCTYCTDYEFGYNGFIDNLTTLLSEDDAATANWGNGWLMPTKEQCMELLEDTASTETMLNGVNGMLLTGANGNSIFLPFAGWYIDDDGVEGGELYGVRRYYTFWSSSLNFNGPYCAWGVKLENGYYRAVSLGREGGSSIRPVRSAN